MSQAGAVPSANNRFPYRVLIRLGLILIYLVAIAAGGYVTFVRVRDEVASSDILPDFTIAKPADEVSPNVERAEGEALPEWTGTDPVTVLILGIDERVQEDDFWRTDTMMLATLNPVTMQAGVLSIPRDLWVPIPGYTENRINTAHALGDAYDHPGGGPALAVETVEYNLGVEITYYVRVNFQAFIDIVDLIGGITIDVPEPIDDDCYPTPDYGCEQLHFDAGEQHFYGDMALKYARVRHTSGGDFDRARRQQQVMRAILEQVTNTRKLPQLAARAPEIWQTVEHSTKLDPDLQLDEIIALANLATQVDPDDIRFRVIDETCTLFAETPDEMQILIPLRDKIRAVRDQVFGLENGNNERKTAETEAASVAILNGTTTAGLAYATTEYLEANGLSIAHYDNADRQDYDTSLIILNRDMPMTAQQLLSMLNLPDSAVVNGSNPTAEYDVVVILGSDASVE
ncbi:MAG: LCP family protein [Anaerolineae bacterium]|nr:LCP family protein [Anaerolineae bacterium]